MKNHKNCEIELLRFLMIIGIAILHFSEDYVDSKGFLPGGYLGVDFFFMLSGAFLYKNWVINRENDQKRKTIHYVCNRICKLYPLYFIALMLMIVTNQIINQGTIGSFVKSFWVFQWNFIPIQMLGATVSMVMRSIWFIPPLLVLSWLLYAWLEFNEKSFDLFAPLIVIFVYIYIMRNYGTLSMQGEYAGIFSGAILRGFANMSSGIFVVKSVDFLNKKNYAIRNIWLILCRILSFTLIILIMHLFGFNYADFSILIPFMILLFCSFYKPFSFGKLASCIRVLGESSYVIFLTHLIVSKIICTFFQGKEYYIMLPVFLIISTIFSVLINQIYMRKKDMVRCCIHKILFVEKKNEII